MQPKHTVSIWKTIFGVQESARSEVTALAWKYVEQADQIPAPTERINSSLNMLGRALHYFVVALRAQTSASREDLLLYRDFLARIRPLLDQQHSAAPDLAPMVAARFSLLSSALEILESGRTVTDAIRPSPEQTALWTDIASGRKSGRTNQTSTQIEAKRKEIEALQNKLTIAEVNVRTEVKKNFGNLGFTYAIKFFCEHKDSELAAAGLMVICEDTEKRLTTIRTSREFARRMIICSSAWVERELLSPRHKEAAELLRQHYQQSLRGVVESN